MAGVPSIGDILMLSQLAWKIGRSFTSGRSGAPTAFLQVEAEINGLAKALKLFAEALFADTHDNPLDRAGQDTQNAVGTIILSSKQSLQDLDSLVEQYQVIKKHRTSGGFSIERSWSDLVLSSYRKMIWTTEGGNIEGLRDTLHMHTSTITLVMQAMQSNSLARLQQIALPVGEKVEKVHGDGAGAADLSKRLDQVHTAVVEIAGASPVLPTRSLRTGNSGRSESMRLTASRRESDYSLNPSYSDISEHRSSISSARLTAPGSPTTGLRHSKWSNADLPAVHDADEAEWDSASLAMSTMSAPALPPPVMPPVMPPDPDPGIEAADQMSSFSLRSIDDSDKIVVDRAETTASQHEAFERAAFRNSAILCDLRGTAVEYLKPPDDESRPLEAGLGEAMKDCRICIVRKRDTRPDGSSRFLTSIWALSDDHEVRMQQKLPDTGPLIPYPSYFTPTKISLSLPSTLKFHPHIYGGDTLTSPQTTWINYIFDSPKSATLFQNELYARTLVGAYKTEKTLRVHDGIASVLAYQEQMCGMEMLRLWRDGETGGVLAMLHYSPVFRDGWLCFWLNGVGEGVRAKDEGGKEVKIKGLKIPVDGAATGMVGGRDGGEGGSGSAGLGRSASNDGQKKGKKWITGARIEFATELEKVLFLEKVREVQKQLVVLPEEA
ncbi:hypothetical protein K490DRAFT_43232 [Saccharata proteae CBS 121410]|uniref:Fungal N-terminal domain-containing protein n=1 Tax=Saccharata proteae CBS 121410 TaxID=1314787 RepID=A0A9P4LYD7_9PEZI|nr:hypothetical protein K490DRAFT_43232 [Saccharata proteae CBS 121410]